MAALPPGAYKTYAISRPLATHWRPATCEEVDCPNYLNGWVTIVPVDHPEIEVLKRGRWRYREYRGFVPDEVASQMPDYDPAHPGGRELGPGLVAFVFEAGQTCFIASTHRVLLERPELYLVKGGNLHGNPAGVPTFQHSGPDAWVNDFGQHQEDLNRLINGT